MATIRFPFFFWFRRLSINGIYHCQWKDTHILSLFLSFFLVCALPECKGRRKSNCHRRCPGRWGTRDSSRCTAIEANRQAGRQAGGWAGDKASKEEEKRWTQSTALIECVYTYTYYMYTLPGCKGCRKSNCRRHYQAHWGTRDSNRCTAIETHTVRRLGDDHDHDHDTPKSAIVHCAYRLRPFPYLILPECKGRRKSSCRRRHCLGHWGTRGSSRCTAIEADTHAQKHRKKHSVTITVRRLHHRQDATWVHSASQKQLPPPPLPGPLGHSGQQSLY